MNTTVSTTESKTRLKRRLTREAIRYVVICLFSVSAQTIVRRPTIGGRHGSPQDGACTCCWKDCSICSTAMKKSKNN